MIRDKFEAATEVFFYIANSAAFTLEFLEKAQCMSIHVITRMPDNILETKRVIDQVVNNLATLPLVAIENAKGTTDYRVMSSRSEYHGIPLNVAGFYSSSLEPQKRSTIQKQVMKEYEEIKLALSRLAKREFACLEDASIEQKKYEQGVISKLKYHSVTLAIQTQAKRGVGRPSKQNQPKEERFIFQIDYELSEQADAIELKIKRECVFCRYIHKARNEC